MIKILRSLQLLSLLLVIAITIISCRQLKVNAPDDSKKASRKAELALIDKRLGAEQDSIIYWHEHREIDNADNNLEAANAKFEAVLLEALNKYHELLDYDFKFLDKPVTSPNKKLSAYSWDTQMGGTMRDYQTIFQYQVKDGTKAENFTDIGEDGEVYLCTDIFSIVTKYGIVYMPVTFMTESSLYYYNSVKFLVIKDNKLIPINLIKSDEDMQDNVGVEYINYYGQERTNIPEKLIEFDSKNQILKIVRTDDKQNIINAYDLYKFNGTYFENQK